MTTYSEATWDDNDFVQMGPTRVHPVRDENGHTLGLVEYHDENGVQSAGSVPISDDYLPGKPHWQVTAGNVDTLEGLTLTPSIACSTCGHHGWIIDGQWVDA